MSNWRRLRRDPPASLQLLQVVGLAGMIGAVIYLGWRFSFKNEQLAEATLLPPTTTPEQTILVPDAMGDFGEAGRDGSPAATVTPSPTIAVPETGGRVDNIGGFVRVGSPAPGFTLKDLLGNTHSLSDHRNEVVLINFWTTWCPPCREEMPALQKAYEHYRERGFVVLGVNWTEVDDREQVAPFVEELGLTFPVLLDIDSIVSYETYKLLGLPTSVFVGREGMVSEVYIGALDLDNLASKIERLLETTS